MSTGTNRSLASFSFLTNGPEEAKPTKVKIRKSDIIKYPIFASASEVLTDEYWKDVLMKAAKGKFPRGFSFQNGFLIQRASGFRIQLPDDLNGLIQSFILFLQEWGNIYSPDDLVNLTLMAEKKFSVEDEQVTWSRIYRSKNTRARYVRNFVESEYSNLSREYQDQLFTQINLALKLGTLEKADIVFQNGRIQSISQIVFNSTGFHVGREYKNKIIKSVTSVSDEDEEYTKWLSYLEDFIKNVMERKSNTVELMSLTSYES